MLRRKKKSVKYCGEKKIFKEVETQCKVTARNVSLFV